jgi:hypothetical protein
MSRWSLITVFLAGVIMITSCDKNPVVDLNGRWQLAPDSTGQITINSIDLIENWRMTEIPGSWHRLHMDLLDYQGVVWYRKSFKLKSLPLKHRFLLNFGAVDYLAKVYVNRELVGEHEGGYTPFSFDVTEQLQKGENEILVRVVDPVADEFGTDGISYWHIPHGKQNWYVQTSGIWQAVTMVIKPEIYVTRVQVNSQIRGTFQAKVFIENAGTGYTPVELILTIRDPGDKIVFSTKREVNYASSAVEFTGQIDNPQLWDVDQPNLYTLEIRLGEDILYDRFGFREIVVRDRKLYVNGKPFYLIGALDQDFYPETVYETPSEKYLYDEMQKARELGLNTLRCHIKVPDPRYLKVADELGLLVWYEIPNWDVFDESVKARSRKTLQEMLQRDWNHPSLAIISLINESWGLDLNQANQRQWLKAEFDFAKSLANGRLIVDNSACWGNYHLKTDINDYHTYWAIPENHQKFSETVQEVADRPRWLFSPHGDGVETGQEVLMISEFGNWGLPRLPEKLPFWFGRQFLDNLVTLPEGVIQRFNDYQYGRMFKNYNELAEFSQKAQAQALKWEIEEIRLQPELQGYVITEFTDINWECNGLLDMWRNFKADRQILAQVQQPDIIIPRLTKYGFWDNEEIDVQLSISHYSNRDFSNVRIQGIYNGEIIGDKSIAIDSVGVYFVGSMKINSEPVKQPVSQRVKFRLLSREGDVLAENFIEYMAFPSRMENQTSLDSDLLVCNSIDIKAIDHLKKGHNVICVIDSSSVLPANFPFTITSRESDGYDGNWASNLNWVDDSHRPFNNLKSNKVLGFEAYKALPKYAITGIQPEQFVDVLAGMYVGWLHLNSAYLMQMRVGSGKLILTTFNLIQNYGDDPFTTTLRDELVAYLQSEDCQPTINWK